MSEVSPWVAAAAIEGVLLVLALLSWRLVIARRAERALVERIRSLEAELEVHAEPPPPPPPPPVAQVVLLTDADLAPLAARADLGGAPGNTEAARAAVEDAHRRFAEASTANQALQGIVDGLLQTQADVVTRIGQLGGPDGLAPDVKARADEVIDVLRAADDALIAASDRVMDSEGVLGGGTAALARFVDGFDWDIPAPSARAINGLLLEKAAAQPEPAELERLRAEAERPSPARAPEPSPEVQAEILRRTQEMAAIEARVRELTTEQARLREHLEAVNDEYQRMVAEHGAPAPQAADAVARRP